MHASHLAHSLNSKRTNIFGHLALSETSRVSQTFRAGSDQDWFTELKLGPERRLNCELWVDIELQQFVF